MASIPYRFLIRTLYLVPRVAGMPQEKGETLVSLPPSGVLNNLAGVDQLKSFAEVRMGWNEAGLGLTCDVRGKENFPLGDADRPRQSDGITVWIDTRGDRTSHRAMKTCHQFHILAAGGGSNKDESHFCQSKIHRALNDAPLCSPGDVPFRVARNKKGYRIEVFFPAAVLYGYDPEQFRQLGVFTSVRDFELGEDTLGVDSNFPFWEDPSLWATATLGV
jgi:hypothetical protein